MFSSRSASPKSTTYGLPSLPIRMLPGFTSLMDESLLVGVVQSVSDGGDQFGGFPVLESLLLQLRSEVGPLDVLRDDVAGTVLCAADIVDGNDVGMIEIGDRASLGQIRLGIFGLRDQFGVRHLDGDRPIQLLVLGQIDETEAPFAQHLLDAVATDPLGMFGGRTFILLDRISLMVLRHIVGI